MNLLLFILTCYGISNIIIFGSIFDGFRRFWNKYNPSFFGKLFTCMICLPTWLGFILGGVFYWLKIPFIWSEVINNHPLLSIFLDGCLASSSTWLLHTLQERLEK